MGQYEPNDSRDVTRSPSSAPGEPARTGYREEMNNRQAEQQSRKSLSEREEQSDADNSWHKQEEQSQEEQGQEARDQSGSREPLTADAGETAQASYGNSRDASRQMEQSAYDSAASSQMEQNQSDSDSFVGETSRNPARRAKADASRPLSGD